jgi:acetyl esterase/lipase
MITGGSYGGYMTLAAALTLRSHPLRGDIVGISNFVTFMERTEAYRRDLRRVEYGDERDPKIRAFFEEIAPLHHADKITKPLFVVAGRNDPRVPYQEGEQMVATVKKNGTPVWFLMAKDEGTVQQEAEPGFPVLRHRRLRPGVPAPVVRRPPVGRGGRDHAMMKREDLLAHYARVRAHYRALAPPTAGKRTRPARGATATSCSA